MKQLLSNYSISGDVVTLTGVDRPLEAVLSITNSTTGSILYTAQTGGATAYTQGTNSTITLSTAPGVSDRLQIFFDDGVAAENAPSSIVADTGLSQPLTDSQLRASAVPVSGPLTDTQLRASAVPISSTALTNIDTDLGALADAAASSDTGSFSLIALTKRILTKLPSLVSGRIPVDGSGVTQPVSLQSSTGSTLTTFTSTTSAQVLAANSNRRGVVLSSPSTNTGMCYVVIGTTTASATAFSLVVNPGDIINLTGINNALTGIWSAASQTLYVTELT